VHYVFLGFDKYYELLYSLDTMSEFARELGSELVENSRLADEFSAQRGLINELFPYVYEASKRMSSRAISRWLAEKGVKLGPATIAKALRNPEPYWQELADEIEPAARLFSDAHDIALRDVLTNGDAASSLAAQPPVVAGATRGGIMDSLSDIENATEKLLEWFKLPDSAREACLGSAEFGLDKDEKNDLKGESEQ
jgi:hypothetical protein